MITDEQPSGQATGRRRTSKGSGHVRWWIAWTLFCSTSINYISRQSFAVLAPMIVAQFHMSHDDLGRILAPFKSPTRSHGSSAVCFWTGWERASVW